jgi:hypothetical protein
MKETENRQEPFVYGSLGGNNVSLVSAPAEAREAPVNEIKTDFELVQKIGTKRAWEVFLRTHPSGFYAELAHAQIEAFNHISWPLCPRRRPIARQLCPIRHNWWRRRRPN